MPTAPTNTLTIENLFMKALYEKVSNNTDFRDYTGGDGSDGSIPCFANEQAFTPGKDWDVYRYRAFYKLIVSIPMDFEQIEQQGTNEINKIDFRIKVVCKDTSVGSALDLEGIIRSILNGGNIGIKSDDTNGNIYNYYCTRTGFWEDYKQPETNFWTITTEYSAISRKS